jgi:hypothetical protein
MALLRGVAMKPVKLIAVPTDYIPVGSDNNRNG